MARRAGVAQVDESAADDIVAWYRDLLAGPAVAPWAGLVLPDGSPLNPALIGPTWQTTSEGEWVLPDRTLGWQVLVHCGLWHQHRSGVPWQFTGEQARWILWWYAVNDDNEFAYRDGVFQRVKGHGKDPLGANLCGVELAGPCRIDPEGREDQDGNPLGVEHGEAWVQTAAVSLEQTKNTMRLFPTLFTPEAKARFGLQVGKEIVHGFGGERMIQAVTSSPATLEGARSTFTLKNETHHWLSNNEGHEMAAVIDRNATKSEDGSARTLSITNAPEPGEDSVAERERDGYNAGVSRTSLVTGILYDSLEAPPDAPLSAEAAPAVVEAVRGDSVWLNVKRIVQAILDPRNPPSRSRRFWYNQLVATEDAWIAPFEWDAGFADVIVPDGEIITLGFDGSKSDDHSALIGCVVELDHLFEIDVWAPDEHTNEVDRVAIDAAVRKAFERYDVVAFFSDLHPWESYVDRWAEDLGSTLCVKSSLKQPVAFDMRARTAEFTAGCEALHDAVIEGETTHCGSSRFRQHVHNARRAPNKWGVSIRKEHRESARKIDSLPAAVLARIGRQQYQSLPENRKRRTKRSGRASFL